MVPGSGAGEGWCSELKGAVLGILLRPQVVTLPPPGTFTKVVKGFIATNNRKPSQFHWSTESN